MGFEGDSESRPLGIVSMSVAEAFARRLAAQGKRAVLTNGCFDLLHVGHLRYLEEARSFGDALIVAVNSDESVSRLKGPTRPIVGESDRAELLAGLRCVDCTVVFGEDTAEDVVRAIRPHVYVKGGDYTLDNCPEARIVVGYGGEARFVGLVPGRSTSNLAKRASIGANDK